MGFYALLATFQSERFSKRLADFYNPGKVGDKWRKAFDDIVFRVTGYGTETLPCNNLLNRASCCNNGFCLSLSFKFDLYSLKIIRSEFIFG